MIAPTPSAVSWNGPSVRFRLCAPASFDSSSNMLIGFRANKGLPMHLLLGRLSPLSQANMDRELSHCRALVLFALQQNRHRQYFVNAGKHFTPRFSSALFATTPGTPAHPAAQSTIPARSS